MTFEEAVITLKDWFEKCAGGSEKVGDAGKAFRTTLGYTSLSCKNCDRMTDCYYRTTVMPKIGIKDDFCGYYKDSKCDLHTQAEKA